MQNSSKKQLSTKLNKQDLNSIIAGLRVKLLRSEDENKVLKQKLEEEKENSKVSEVNQSGNSSVVENKLDQIIFMVSVDYCNILFFQCFFFNVSRFRIDHLNLWTTRFQCYLQELRLTEIVSLLLGVPKPAVNSQLKSSLLYFLSMESSDVR